MLFCSDQTGVEATPALDRGSDPAAATAQPGLLNTGWARLTSSKRLRLKKQQWSASKCLISHVGTAPY